jgi:hypothetical protein
MAARTEVPGFARVTQQVVVSAGLAPDAGETEMRIAAGDEPLDRLLFDRALEAPGGAQFFGVPGDALVKRTGIVCYGSNSTKVLTVHFS